MQPSPDAERWFDSGPEAIENDLAGAVLMARIGLASNALNAQLQAARNSQSRVNASALERQVDSVQSFVNAAALVWESIDLARENMPALRELAGRIARPELLVQMGQLCSGNHPSAAILDRARNKLGFHWDPTLIAKSVEQFSKNKRLVWIETVHRRPLHSFAFAVLTHALAPESDTPDPVDARQAARRAFQPLREAMLLIIDFFTASVYGYMDKIGAERRERPTHR
jgi:hypothetical protein